MLAGTCSCDSDAGFFGTARLSDGRGKEVGVAALSEERGHPGVRINLKVWGLPPGVYGFHILQGTRWNRSARGLPHAGDLPNLTIPETGAAEITVEAPLVTLSPGDHSLLRSALAPGGTCLAIDARPDHEQSGFEDRVETILAGGLIRRFKGRPLEDNRQ
jgi:Cu-Zn family superoxide dismutase